MEPPKKGLSRRSTGPGQIGPDQECDRKKLVALRADPAVYSASALSRNLSPWISHLAADRDHLFILSGLRHGFRLLPDLPADARPNPAWCTNYASALSPAVKPFLDQLFRQELADGKLSCQSSRPFRVHSIGAVPKKDSDEFRPITDCSQPRLDAFNDFIRPFVASFDLPSIDDVVTAMSPNCFLAVADIRAAFRSVPVFPTHRQYLGFRWQLPEWPVAHFLIDNCLGFGLSLSPELFHRLSTAVVRMMYRARSAGFIQFSSVVVYLDDFCIIARSASDCQQALDYLLWLLGDLGFEISRSKLVRPCQRLRYLGIEIDSVRMKLFLPQDKLASLRTSAAELIHRGKVTKLELQQFCGLASFASKVVRGARTFSRRLVDRTKLLSEPHHHSRVTKEMRADFEWWISFAAWFNGAATIIADSHLPRLTVQTDASLFGWGAVSADQWLAGSWKGSAEPSNARLLTDSGRWFSQITVPNSVAANINYLELFAVLLSARHWAPRWRNRRVLVQSDNTQTVACINRGTSTNPVTTALLRELFWLSAISNFQITAQHLAGVDNVTADRLSRLADGQQLAEILAESAARPSR